MTASETGGPNKSRIAAVIGGVGCGVLLLWLVIAVFALLLLAFLSVRMTADDPRAFIAPIVDADFRVALGV